MYCTSEPMAVQGRLGEKTSSPQSTANAIYIYIFFFLKKIGLYMKSRSRSAKHLNAKVTGCFAKDAP